MKYDESIDRLESAIASRRITLNYKGYSREAIENDYLINQYAEAIKVLEVAVEQILKIIEE